MPTKRARTATTGRRTGARPETATLTDRATEYFRDRILDLSLEPGAQLDERQLLETSEYGRTPMREALNRLITEGLVVARGSRGVQVAPLNLSNTVELFDAYVLCERMVASMINFADADLAADLSTLQDEYESIADSGDLLAVTKQNELFHRRLALATQNHYVRQYSFRLHNLARRLSYYIYQRERDLSGGPEHLFDQPSKDHRQIISIIRRGDRDALIARLTSHAEYFRNRLGNLITAREAPLVDFKTD